MSVPLLVKDILPGAYGSFPNDLTGVGNTLYFTANNGFSGRALSNSKRVLIRLDFKFFTSKAFSASQQLNSKNTPIEQDSVISKQ